jgi:hypothetical protein
MKTLWILVIVGVAGLAVFIVQSRTISELRQELALARVKQQEAPKVERPPVRTSAEIQDAESKQLREEKTELLRLRGEVNLLREELTALRSRNGNAPVGFASAPTSAPASSQPAAPGEGVIARLGQAASKGDFAALNELSLLAKAASASARTNSTPGDPFAEFRPVFKALAADASNGSATAFEALLRASRISPLNSLAVHTLGEMAGAGHEQALEPLLDPKRYLLTQSTTVTALKPAADAGNARAIQALADVTADPKLTPLWYLAAKSLRGAALAGNATAIDSLVNIVRSENISIRKEAYTALENAAIQHPRAAEAIRKLSE